MNAHVRVQNLRAREIAPAVEKVRVLSNPVKVRAVEALEMSSDGDGGSGSGGGCMVATGATEAVLMASMAAAS